MRILHICNGFTGSKLYDELFSRIAKRGGQQQVIAPAFTIPETTFENYDVTYFQRPRSIISRIFYSRKLHRTQHFIECNTNINDFDLIHAHTLFTDGIPAYRLSKKYNLPYIIAIRNSDVNCFFKYFVHYRKLAYKVLQNAVSIILISPIYKQRIKEIIPSELYGEIENKILIIPNGINAEWLNNRCSKDTNLSQLTEYRIVYCGTFDKNKNLDGLIHAVNNIIKVKKLNIKLILIGLKPGQSSKYINRIKLLADKSHGKIIIKERMTPDELRLHYRDCHLFAMPSHTETFGLVYAEALSQGLPIVYTNREGFDGFYTDGIVGVGVDSHSTDSIGLAINRIITDYESFRRNVLITNLNLFDWDLITSQYIKLYESKIK